MSELERIRQVLRNIQAQKMDQARSDSDIDGEIGTLRLLETSGEHKVAAQLLRELPEPECEAVKSYRAAKQLLDSDIDLENQYARFQIESDELLHKIAHTKRVEAIEAVKERIEKQTDEDGRTYLYDPVSKMQRRSGWDNEFDREDIMREQLATDVIEE